MGVEINVNGVIVEIGVNTMHQIHSSVMVGPALLERKLGVGGKFRRRSG